MPAWWIRPGADEDQPPAGFGRPPEDGDRAWRQQPEL